MRSALRLSVKSSMNFWRKGVGLEYMLFIARSLELQASLTPLIVHPAQRLRSTRRLHLTAARAFRSAV